MPQRHWFGSRPEAVLRRLLLVLLLVLIVRRWICCPTLITDVSMLPTLHSGQLALINKLAYRSRPPQRGDIVAVWTGNQLWIKRILGLPGEEIEFRQGTLYINARPLREPYVKFKGSSCIEPGKLQANHFVAAGDNREPTVIAVITRDRIVGRLMPLRSLGEAPSSR
jgi:signal peptidase I